MPKLYFTGNGPDGRSRIIETKDLDPANPAIVPYASTGAMPQLVKCRTDAKLLSSHNPPGTFRTTIFPWRPGMYTDAHRTISVDVDVVLEGSVIMGLEEGQVTLRKGDVAVLPGTVHTWRATDETGLVLYTIQAAEWSVDDLATPTVTSDTIIHGR